MISESFCEQDYYSTGELADELGVSATLLSKWCRKGKIPPEAFVKRGRTLWYRRDVIDPLINAGMLDPEPQGGLRPSDDPRPEELIEHGNLALLPEHFERYRAFRERKEAGILDASQQFGTNSFGPLLKPRQSPPPSVQTDPIIQPKEETIMTVETYGEAEIAEMLRVSGHRVRAWKRRGVIPAGAVSGVGVYKKSAIDRLIESGVLAAPEPEPAKPTRRKTAAKKPSRKEPESRRDAAPELAALTREEFAQGFWSRRSRAVNVLTLPPETSAAVVRYVNEALQYGHEWLATARGNKYCNDHEQEMLEKGEIR